MIRIVNGSFVVTPADVVASYVDNPEERELVTLTKCISRGGYHVPCMLTFKGAWHLHKYFKNQIDGDTLFS
jgi:hypothetical protein